MITRIENATINDHLEVCTTLPQPNPPNDVGTKGIFHVATSMLTTDLLARYITYAISISNWFLIEQSTKCVRFMYPDNYFINGIQVTIAVSI